MAASDRTRGGTAANASAASNAVRDRIRRVEGAGLRTFADDEPLVWARTKGTRIWDEDGREYLDLYAGYAVAAVGHCHPLVTEAIREQAGTMTHCPSAAPSRVRAEYYERLEAIAPRGLPRVLPSVTGAMANELAIQMARVATGRQTVISFSGTYLGRTVGTVRYAGKRAYREALGVEGDAHFLPYPDPYRSPWACGADPGEVVIALLDQLIDDPASGIGAPACIVFEPIQGNGGVVVAPPGFLRELRRVADKAGAVLIFDEIQCGFGRSGRMWACDYEDVRPDLLTAGKGIGGGLVNAAVLGTDAVMSTLRPDAMTSTFLTNALNAAAASATIDVLQRDGLVERSARLGSQALDRMHSELADVDAVGEVRGRGLFIGIELVADRIQREADAELAGVVVKELRRRGVIVGRGGRYGNVIKLSPALVIDEADLDFGLTAITEVIDEQRGR